MLTGPPVFVASTLVISERVAAEYPDRTLAKSSAVGAEIANPEKKVKKLGQNGQNGCGKKK